LESSEYRNGHFDCCAQKKIFKKILDMRSRGAAAADSGAVIGDHRQTIELVELFLIAG
jgi:hypothetical protein